MSARSTELRLRSSGAWAALLVAQVACGGSPSITPIGPAQTGTADVALTSASPAPGSTIRVTNPTNVPIAVQITVTSTVDATGRILSGLSKTGLSTDCTIGLLSAPIVSLHANQPQAVNLGPYRLDGTCPMPFTTTTIGYEFGDGVLFNTDMPLTYTFSQ
jgi:hypothetical protein